ncbi:MAG: LysM peptidoglycan-binding domain-containing protein [Armatimonadota bacterium]
MHRVLYVGIPLLAVAAVVFALQPKHPYTILVDGKPVATLASAREAESVLEDARSAPGARSRFADKVTIRQAKGSEITDPPEAMRALLCATQVETELWTITVDGTPVAALASRGDAGRALKLVKEHYEKKIKSRKIDSEFKESVLVEDLFVPASLYCPTAGDAAKRLTSQAEPPVYHIIERGDRTIKLAARYGISLDELKGLNPGVNLMQIVEGNRLMVRRAKLPITVVSKAVTGKTVEIASPSGRKGSRKVTSLSTYENGRLANEEVVSAITVWR